MNSRKEILDLLAKGKISADEAAEMLNNPEATPEPNPIPVVEETAVVTKTSAFTDDSQYARWFKVRVRNMETGKNKVSVNIPIGMLKIGMKVGKRFSPEINGIKLEEFDDMIQDMKQGMLVEVQDEESKEHVQIYLE